MTTLPELIQRDSITAAWFWVTSLSTGPYAENEMFDAVFTRDTNYVVGGGYHERRTFYIKSVTTDQSMSRRENSGHPRRPDLACVLAHTITDAHQAAQYGSFREWATDQRDSGQEYRHALDDFEEWQDLRSRWQQILPWIGDQHDEYVKAAEEYAAEH
jgi:hypothetical protein